MWGQPFYLKGIAMDNGQMIEVGYEMVECRECGAIVSTENQQLHEEHHRLA